MDSTTLLFLMTAAFVLWPRRIEVFGGKRRPAIFGIAWLALVAISVAVSVVAALLQPKPKGPKPASVTDLQDPTNDAGREIGVVFGEGVVKSPNILWFGDKGTRNYKVSA